MGVVARRSVYPTYGRSRLSSKAARFGVLIAIGACGCLAPHRGSVTPPARHHVIQPPALPPTAQIDAPGLAHLLKGLYFIHTGSAAAAIPHLRLALVYDDDSAYLHGLLATAWLATGDERLAQTVLERGLGKNPDDAGLNLLAGRRAHQGMNYEGAISFLTIAMKSGDFLPQAAPLLVDALLWQRQFEAAQQQCKRALEEHPRDTLLALALAANFEDHGRLDDALKLYATARLRSPRERYASVGEARVLTLQGHYEDAATRLIGLFRYLPSAADLYVEVAHLLRLGGADARDADAYRDEAMHHAYGGVRGAAMIAAGDLRQGDTERGIEMLRKMIGKYPWESYPRVHLARALRSPDSPEACLGPLTPKQHNTAALAVERAMCFVAAADIESALGELRLSHERGAPAASILHETAHILGFSEDYKKAVAHLDEMRLHFHGKSKHSDYVLARASLAQAFGDSDRALDMLRKLASKPEQQPILQLRLADAEAKVGAVDEAVARLERLVAEEPMDIIRLNALGYTLADAGVRLEDAVVWLRRAYRLAPQEPFIADSLGWALFRRGDVAEAERLIERAAAASWSDPEILMHLGELRAKGGAHEQARDAYRRALERLMPARMRLQVLDRLESLGGAT